MIGDKTMISILVMASHLSQARNNVGEIDGKLIVDVGIVGNSWEELPTSNYNPLLVCSWKQSLLKSQYHHRKILNMYINYQNHHHHHRWRIKLTDCHSAYC